MTYVGMKYSREWYEEQALESLDKVNLDHYNGVKKNEFLLKKAEVYAILATVAPSMESNLDNG